MILRIDDALGLMSFLCVYSLIRKRLLFGIIDSTNDTVRGKTVYYYKIDREQFGLRLNGFYFISVVIVVKLKIFI